MVRSGLRTRSDLNAPKLCPWLRGRRVCRSSAALESRGPGRQTAGSQPQYRHWLAWRLLVLTRGVRRLGRLSWVELRVQEQVGTGSRPWRLEGSAPLPVASTELLFKHRRRWCPREKCPGVAMGAESTRRLLGKPASPKLSVHPAESQSSGECWCPLGDSPRRAGPAHRAGLRTCGHGRPLTCTLPAGLTSWKLIPGLCYAKWEQSPGVRGVSLGRWEEPSLKGWSISNNASNSPAAGRGAAVRWP